MLISKFGLSKKKNDDDSYHRWNDIMKNYVYENVLFPFATDFDARLCKIRHLAQPEVDTDAVNKLYVEQRVKTLTNQQKASDERLTSFKKDVWALQIITSFSVRLSKPSQKQRRITMSGNERRRDGYERQIISNGSWINNGRFKNGSQIATKQLRIAIEQLRNGYQMAIERL